MPVACSLGGGDETASHAVRRRVGLWLASEAWLLPVPSLQRTGYGIRTLHSGLCVFVSTVVTSESSGCAPAAWGPACRLALPSPEPRFSLDARGSRLEAALKWACIKASGIERQVTTASHSSFLSTLDIHAPSTVDSPLSPSLIEYVHVSRSAIRLASNSAVPQSPGTLAHAE